MRLSSQKRSEKKMELSTTGMIDIVFLLLVFFLVTSSFIPPEKELRPAIQTESKNSKSNSDLERAMIEIVPEGAIHLYKLGSTKTTDISELLESLQAFPNKLDGAFVRADNDAPFDMTAQAISAAKKSGFVIVTFLAESD